MKLYANRTGQSGVYAYEIGSDNIHVKFRTGSTYVYDYASAGSSSVEQMKSLAIAGSGLNSFINSYVKHKYAYKYR